MEDLSQEDGGEEEEEEGEEDPEVGDAEESETSQGAPAARAPVPGSAAAAAAARPHLQPFGAGAAGVAAAAGQFDDGDSIVPSTPTLMVPRRGDAFAESVPSPQVRVGREEEGGRWRESPVRVLDAG